MRRTFVFGALFLFFACLGIAHAAVYSNDSNSVDINYTGPAPGSIPGVGFPDDGTGGGNQGDTGASGTQGAGGDSGDGSGGQSGVTIPVTVVTGEGGNGQNQAGSSGNSGSSAHSGNGANDANGGSAPSIQEVLASLIGHQAVSYGANSGSSGGGDWGTITISAKKAREALAVRSVSRISLSDLLNSRFFTREDFTIVAASKILDNKTIEEVILTLDTLTLTYHSEGRLFAVFPFSYPVTLVIDPNLDTREKRIKVKFPWYRFFLQTFVTRTQLQSQLDSAITQAIIGADAGADVKTKVLVAVTQTLESRFDTVEGSVQ